MGEEAGPAKSEFPWPQRRGLLHAKNQPTNIRFRLYAKKTCLRQVEQRVRDQPALRKTVVGRVVSIITLWGQPRLLALTTLRWKRLFGIEGR